ncbi:hypothetical protein AHAS_Ahas05G0107700 [Arachis hypogaea]
MTNRTEIRWIHWRNSPKKRQSVDHEQQFRKQGETDERRRETRAVEHTRVTRTRQRPMSPRGTTRTRRRPTGGDALNGSSLKNLGQENPKLAG